MRIVLAADGSGVRQFHSRKMPKHGTVQNILVVSTDGSPRSRGALDRAATLAEENGAQLTALSILESLPRDLQRLGAVVDVADLWEVAVKERRQKVAGLIARSWKQNGSVTAKVLGGSPFIEVIKEVLRQGHDLVIMAAEGKVESRMPCSAVLRRT